VIFMASRSVALLTDFGNKDPYVAIMKATILSRAPNAVLVDITHDIEPFNVVHGARVLQQAFSFFPQGTIFVAVVDPGVGSKRQGVCLTDGNYTFVGPDNGLLSGVIPGIAPAQTPRSHTPFSAYQFRLQGAWRGVSLHLPDKRTWKDSTTFDGRDVFGPAAGLIAAENPAIESLGIPITEIVCLSLGAPTVEGLVVRGEVAYVDHFGNLVTNISKMLIDHPQVAVEVNDYVIDGIVANYSVEERLIALIGSHGFLEIAMPRGNAAELLQARAGIAVTVKGRG